MLNKIQRSLGVACGVLGFCIGIGVYGYWKHFNGLDINKLKNNQQCTPISRGEVTVTVSQKKRLPATIGELSMVIETRHADSLMKAQQLNNQIAQKVYDCLNAELVKNNLHHAHNYLQTINLQAGEYYNTVNQQRVLMGYQVTRQLKLHTTHLAKLDELAQLALKTGVTRIERVIFKLPEELVACEHLIAPVMQLARQRSDHLARQTDSRLVGVKQINAQCLVKDSVPPWYYLTRLENTASPAMLTNSKTQQADSTSTVVREVEVELQVQAQWYIDPTVKTSNHEKKID